MTFYCIIYKRQKKRGGTKNKETQTKPPNLLYVKGNSLKLELTSVLKVILFVLLMACMLMVNCNIADILIIQNLVLICYFSNGFKDIAFTLDKPNCFIHLNVVV